MTQTLRHNFFINVAGSLIPLVVSLVTVPVYIRHVGDARYGVLSIVWILLGYLGFLDFGLSRTAVRALSRLKHAPQAERARVLVTTLILNLCLGLFGSAILALAGGYLLQHVLTVPRDLRPEISHALPWIVGLFPLALVGGVGIGTIESRERFLLANVLSVCGTAAGQIIPVILAIVIGPSLAIVIPAAVLVRGAMVFLVFYAVWQQERPLYFRHADRAKALELLSYGSWLTVSGVISPILVSFDQFVIGSLLSVTSVAHYAVPMNLVMRSQMFPSALVRTLFPRLSSLGPIEARALANRAFTAIAFGYATLCAPAIVAAPTFFRYWVGPEFATTAAPVAAVLFVGAWINSLAFVSHELLQSQGRPDITGKLHAIEFIPFIAILWICTSTFGLLGAATAWTMRTTADGLCLFIASDMPIKVLRQTVVPLFLLVAAGLLSQAIDPDPWKSLSTAAAMGFISGVLALVKVSDLRQLMRTFMVHAGVPIDLLV